MPSTRLVLAALVVLATVSGTGLATSSRLTIDAEHPLAESDAIDTYRSEGVVSANTPQVDLTVTVADDAADVGLDGPLRLDGIHTYVRLDYDESVARTVRIYLPGELVEPRVKQDLETVTGNNRADFAPTRNRTYQSVTIRLDGETDAVFALSDAAGSISAARSWTKDKVGNATGVPMPSLGSGNQWEYIDPDEYGPNRSRSFRTRNTTWTIQRQATRDGETVWLPVATCDDPSSQPACLYGATNQTVLMTTSENPPRIRYKRGRDVAASLGAMVDDLLSIPGRILDSFGGLFGGA